MKNLKSVTVVLDVRSKYDGGKLDESIDVTQIKAIAVTYFNRGEGEEWEADVPFTVVGQLEEDT